MKGRTYAKRGEKTVRLKGGKSRHNKRIYTLQIAVFIDGILRYKPLLIFKRKPKSKDRRRRTEAQLYHPIIIIILNKKVYANTSNLIDWIKNQYSIASAYPLQDNEPRFLALNAFAPHKNKGVKVRANESKAARKKREKEERLQ